MEAAYRVHTTLGPGLFERIYVAALAHELTKQGLNFTREQEIPVIYDGVNLDVGFRADLIVEDTAIVEIKSINEMVAIHRKQLLTYLRLANKPVGLLINFNVYLIKDGIARILNGSPDSRSNAPDD